MSATRPFERTRLGEQRMLERDALAEANENIFRSVRDSTDGELEWEFFCECGREDCHERVFLGLDAYVALRDHGGVVLANGHSRSGGVSDEPRRDLLPPRRRHAVAVHLRAASTHDHAADLHEAAAKLQEEHAVEMREAGREASASRAERLAARERQRANDERSGAGQERSRADEAQDASRQQVAPEWIQ